MACMAQLLEKQNPIRIWHVQTSLTFASHKFFKTASTTVKHNSSTHGYVVIMSCIEMVGVCVSRGSSRLDNTLIAYTAYMALSAWFCVASESEHEKNTEIRFLQ